MKDTVETKTDLVALPEGLANLAKFFSEPETVNATIAKIAQIVADHVPDLTTAKGRAAIKSLAASVSRSKTFLDNAGKELNAGKRAEIDAVDAERRKIRDELDALRDTARKPLTEWEEAEEARKAKIKAKIDALTADGFTAMNASADIQARIAELEAVTVDDTWGEFADDAAINQAMAIDALRAILDAAKAREESEAELEALRKEKAEREARDAAEAQAKAEREAAEREAAEKERQARDAEERRIAAEERAAKEKAEAAERARKDAEEKAAREKAEAEAKHKRELAEAEQRAAAAAEAERKRLAAERAAEQAEQDRREKNKRIRKERVNQIGIALCRIEPFTPEAVAEAIVAGSLPNVTVKF